VVDALGMAARNHNLADACIFHSDRGSQYTSAEFVEALALYDMRQSLGRTGSCLLTGQCMSEDVLLIAA
jgi:transposase InsO family protein